jgi:hypothetical protein
MILLRLEKSGYTNAGNRDLLFDLCIDGYPGACIVTGSGRVVSIPVLIHMAVRCDPGIGVPGGDEPVAGDLKEA